MAMRSAALLKPAQEGQRAASFRACQVLQTPVQSCSWPAAPPRDWDHVAQAAKAYRRLSAHQVLPSNHRVANTSCQSACAAYTPQSRLQKRGQFLAGPLRKTAPHPLSSLPNATVRVLARQLCQGCEQWSDDRLTDAAKAGVETGPMGQDGGNISITIAF